MQKNYLAAHRALHAQRQAKKGMLLQRFFKTGKGEYAEGDRFLGIMVPVVRKLVREYEELSLQDIERLLQSPFNEERLMALLLWVRKYQKAEPKVKAAIVKLYLKNLKQVNNWNLVDLSAHYILGDHLLTRDRALLYRLVKSKSLWFRRVAVISTFAFIRENQFADSFSLTKLLLMDEHDLIHKACGWMLREVGKRDVRALETFLNSYKSKMPRTMLRYAIERFPEKKRKAFLK